MGGGTVSVGAARSVGGENQRGQASVTMLAVKAPAEVFVTILR